ncbi:MAG: penicillin-binding transpeptidase domain-containing protein [Micromonosporaceae bacterium]
MGGARRVAGGLVAVLVLALGAAACTSEPGPGDALEEFLRHWRANKLAAARYQGQSGEEVATAYRRVAGDLAERPPKLVAGKVTESEGRATGSVEVAWPVVDGATWRYRTAVPLVMSENGWRVDWSAAVVHPGLAGGNRLVLRRTPAPRGPITDRAGKPIVTTRPVVYVGVHPQWVEDADRLAADLGRVLKIDTSDLPKRIAAAKPTDFVDVVTLRREDYLAVKSRLQPLAGTVFREGKLPLAPSRQFARALLGTAGPVTKEVMDAAPGRYQVGDIAGLSGLQRRYDQRLVGVPGVTVVAEPADGSDGSDGDGASLFEADPKQGRSLRLTLDPRVQRAADAALATEKRKAALVALRVSDGAILAVANGPDGGTENLAFEATVPPGSTFKVVSSLALLERGVTADKTVPCPKYATVEGRRFRNDHGFALGDVPFRTAFARSCNTTFVSLAPQLGDSGLTEAGTLVGLGTDWRLGVDAHTGAVPKTVEPADRAAAAFGQGEVTVSPLAMAGVAGAVANGRWQQPRLILDPATEPERPGEKLDPGHVQTLRSLMRAVVTEGTATALADAPGGPVYGKTGTAEYGSDNPPRSHAWFIGWQGDTAFAVLVLNGGSSSETAVPLTERFLAELHS